MALFRLKTKKQRDKYPRGWCAASRCYAVSSVTYSAPEGPWPGEDVPLCDDHHGKLCDWQASQPKER